MERLEKASRIERNFVVESWREASRVAREPLSVLAFKKSTKLISIADRGPVRLLATER